MLCPSILPGSLHHWWLSTTNVNFLFTIHTYGKVARDTVLHCPWFWCQMDSGATIWSSASAEVKLVLDGSCWQLNVLASKSSLIGQNWSQDPSQPEGSQGQPYHGRWKCGSIWQITLMTTILSEQPWQKMFYAQIQRKWANLTQSGCLLVLKPGYTGHFMCIF